MIPIKEHNEIVQKLMKEITNKEAEIKNINREKNKNIQQIPQLVPTQGEKHLNVKINQLNKEHKDKINMLTQQIRNKSLENKDLKQRLTTKANLQAKEKDHVAEMLKKSYDRKPSSAADYKISALITHYEAQISKKTKFIDSLQKQIRQYQMNTTKDNELPEQKNENFRIGNQSDERSKGVSFAEHQKQMNRMKMDVQKYKRLHEQREKEYKDLARRYTELTNQYYKVLNSYGIEQPKKKTQTDFKKNKSVKCIKALVPVERQLKKHALSNLLQQMIVTDGQAEDFPPFKQVQRHKKRQFQPNDLEEQQTEEQNMENDVAESFAVSRIEQIMRFLTISDASEIIPRLAQMKTKISDFELADTIVRSLQVFFYNVGKGKIIKTDLVRILQDFEVSYNRSLQAVDLLDQLCIQIGAKRQKVSEKLSELLQMREQYFSQMRNIKYVQQLSKNNKVMQFIDFFQLDKEDLTLPQQLAQIQEQLKAINKFVKEVRIILQVDNEKSPQMVLELGLRYIEKASSLVNNYQKKAHKIKNSS